jgi:hypothetical protein
MKPTILREILTGTAMAVLLAAFFALLLAVDGCETRAAVPRRVPMRLGIIETTDYCSYAEVATPDGRVLAFCGLLDPSEVEPGVRCIVYWHPLTHEWVVGQVVIRELR